MGVGFIAQSVVCLTADLGVASSDPTVLSTSFRRSFFAWRFTHKKYICKLLS